MTRERSVAFLGGLLLASGAIVAVRLLLVPWLDPVDLDHRAERIGALAIASAVGLILGTAIRMLRRWIAARLVPLMAGVGTLAMLLVLVGAADLFMAWRIVRRAAVAGEMEGALHQSHPRLGWVPRPGADVRHRLEGNFDVRYRIDSDGFRDVPSRGEVARRIYFFGDSFTFGHGVSNAETFTHILASDHLGPEVGVENVGVNAYGVVQMYARLLELRQRLRPGDLVVFSPISHDVRRNLRDFDYVSQYSWAREDMRYPFFEAGTVRGVEMATPWNRARALFLHAPLSRDIFQYVWRAIAAPPNVREAREVFAAARELCEARGVRFALVFLPRLEESRNGRYKLDLSSIDHLDISGFFPRSEAGVRAIGFPDDDHWNGAGHEIAARALAQTLTTAGLLEPRRSAAGSLRGE